MSLDVDSPPEERPPACPVGETPVNGPSPPWCGPDPPLGPDPATRDWPPPRDVAEYFSWAIFCGAPTTVDAPALAWLAELAIVAM